MKTISLDLRKRIVAAYDRGEGTQEQIGRRFDVSQGLVKKLLAQRKRTGDLAPRHRFSGRKPKLLAEHREKLRKLVESKPDLTLKQLKERSGLDCTVPMIHYLLVEMGLTYKKRHCAPRSNGGRTSSKRVVGGRGGKRV